MLTDSFKYLLQEFKLIRYGGIYVLKFFCILISGPCRLRLEQDQIGKLTAIGVKDRLKRCRSLIFLLKDTALN